MSFKRFPTFTLVFCILLFNSCEKERGDLVDTSLSSPFLISLTSANSMLNLDTTTSGAVTKLPGMKFTISGTISVQAIDPDGVHDIKQIRYHIYEPRSSNYISSGILNYTDSVFSAGYSFTIDRSEVGIYRIEAYAQDQSNLISNYLQTSLIITRNNSAPQISNIVAPDTLKRPTSGTVLAFFSLTVNDSDGYRDIDEAFFKRVSPPSTADPIMLLDNGDQQVIGDLLAGDGIFSRIVQINSTALLGEQIFLFLAKDKTGAFSDSLKDTVTVIP